MSIPSLSSSSGSAGTSGPITDREANPTNAGQVTNGGLTINQGYRFDAENPLHWAGAVVLGVVVIKVLKKRVK